MMSLEMSTGVGRLIPDITLPDLEGRPVRLADRPECVTAVDQFRSGTMQPFERTPQGHVGAPGPVSGLGNLTPVERELYDARVRLGAALGALGRQQEAVGEWQKEQLARDQADEEAMRQNNCGPDGCVIPAR